MRRRDNCLNSTVDLRIQEKSYTNHIMTLRRIKPSIETSQPETPLHFVLQQESWEKNREENIERSNLLQSRTQFSKTNNKSVSFTGISGKSNQSKKRPNSSYSSSKIYNNSSSRIQKNNNNYHISESQVFLTQTNVNSRPKQQKKTKLDIFLSKTPPNQWKEIPISSRNDFESEDDRSSKIEQHPKKIERSPYRPAAKKVLKMQKIVSNQFNKRYLRTEMSLRKSFNMNSESNFETDSECVANITDDNMTSENSALKNFSAILNREKSSSEKVDKKSDNENDLEDDFEKFDNEQSNSNNEQSKNDRSSELNANDDDDEKVKKIDESDQPKKKRKKVIRKKIRKVKVIRQPQNEELQDFNFSDD